MVLQGSLNGTRQPGDHPALPLSPWALAQDARAVYDLGVRSVHVHPRCGKGAETIAPDHVGDVVAAIRAEVPNMEIAVPTCRWVQPCPNQRMDTVSAWGMLGQAKPDVVAVNVHEDGWKELCTLACDLGIGLELGVWTPGDAIQLRQAGLPRGVVRVVVEPTLGAPEVAVHEAAKVIKTLGSLVAHVPVLLHGEDASAWSVLEYAVGQGYHARIGLEDVLTNPNGSATEGNADLVRHANMISARGGPRACRDDLRDTRRLARSR